MSDFQPHPHIADGYPYAQHCPNCQAIEAAERARIRAAVEGMRHPAGRSSASYDVMTRGGAFDAVLAIIDGETP